VSGEWRVSDEEIVERLRHACDIARASRTSEAWAEVQRCIERCKRFGVPDARWQSVL